MTASDSVLPLIALDDDALTRKLTALIAEERRTLAEFLQHLAEFDARKLYRGLGFPSLFEYCRDGLKLSNASAFRRYTVARLLHRFPIIAELLADGRLSLTRVAKLKDVLTDDNHLELLRRASEGTERDVEVLVASVEPRPDVTDGIRMVTVRPATSASEVDSMPQAPSAPARATSAAEVDAMSQAPSTPALATSAAEVDAMPRLPLAPARVTSAAALRARMEVEATSATAFSVRMRVGPEFLAEFEAVKAALSHKIPDGNFEAVLRECFRLTLEACDRRRAAATRRCGTAATEEPAPAPRADDAASVADAAAMPDTSIRSKESRYIPARVRRAVWKRDGGRCAFVSADGRRCDSRHQVELHHQQPFATGGPATEDNLSLRCRQHNLYEAELAFGAGFMREKSAKRSPIPRPRAGARASRAAPR